MLVGLISEKLELKALDGLTIAGLTVCSGDR